MQNTWSHAGTHRTEANGAFRLAKVNVDESPNLALRYGIHSIPAVKAFRNSTIVAEFVGVQPEARIRDFLRSIAPSQIDLMLEKGQSMLGLQQPAEAEQAFREALSEIPENTTALLGLAKSRILQGDSTESIAILRSIPPSREFSSAKMMLPLCEVMQDIKSGRLKLDEHPLDPAFERAIWLIVNGKFEAAMDGLLDILREDKSYRSGIAKAVMLALLEALGEASPITRQYRSELTSILF